MKTETLNMRLTTEAKAALKRAADRELRTLSSMAEFAIYTWLRQNGHLPSTAQELVEDLGRETSQERRVVGVVAGRKLRR